MGSLKQSGMPSMVDAVMVWLRSVTVKLQVPMWPQASVAVQDTTVVPTGKTLPEAGVQWTGR